MPTARVPSVKTNRKAIVDIIEQWRKVRPQGTNLDLDLAHTADLICAAVGVDPWAHVPQPVACDDGTVTVNVDRWMYDNYFADPQT